jgi:hypothetical protein
MAGYTTRRAAGRPGLPWLAGACIVFKQCVVQLYSRLLTKAYPLRPPVCVRHLFRKAAKLAV